jgi:hypothetical protein
MLAWIKRLNTTPLRFTTMPSDEHLKILRDGIKVWNDWREDHPRTVPNLSEIDLSSSELTGVNLSYANLTSTILSRADLSHANLEGANLQSASLIEANLEEANLSSVNFSAGLLANANLTKANLKVANFNTAGFYQTDFSRSLMAWTVFCNVDLRQAKGLESVFHIGPSSIGIDTIYVSKGHIPDAFLKGAGISENLIEQVRLIRNQAAPFYSCFISYSSSNQDFAYKLRNDLVEKGVRCWYAPEDLKIGDEIRVSIDKSIGEYDKLLLILSDESIASDWVEQEVETAQSKERELDRTVLFPIRLDNSVLNARSGWAVYIRNTRYIGDFQNWQNEDDYKKGLARLVRDLRAEDVKETRT